ncbi:MAG: LysR family transcriptional regulator [Hyphomicrobiales bacterium]|nr:MAG: LysR family transcriptional regulator [Hyphomicrobiales bacterium]
MRLPPLNALRAFEAAARLGGFTNAAEELNVTPAAISHQVKTLEAHLQTQLFLRLPRGLKLTNAGQELLPEISRGLAHFARAAGRLSGEELAGRLTINVVPSFATLWLVPRLGSFTQTFPDIRIRILASLMPPDLKQGEVDVRITYGKGNYPGFNARYLMGDTIFPVCAPAVLNQQPLRRFQDLQHHTLLHDIDVGEDEPTMTWARWLRDAGLNQTLPEGGIEFSDSILLTQAAVRGQGVALGRMSLVHDHLETGRLVRPLNISRPSDYAYYLVTTEAGAGRARVRVFMDWITAQVRDSQREG